jgi:broad specificity phosphatase PhoE
MGGLKGAPSARVAAVATRIFLICHGSTAATRSTAFPLDEPLEPSAVDAATALADRFPSDRPACTSPALRCRQTARAIGLSLTVDPGLADWDLGDWAGQSLDELTRNRPDDVHAWTTSPTSAAHGGESLTELIERVGSWLDNPAPDRPARLIAVTHPGVIRSAVVHALQAPPHSFWRIDVAPLAVVQLRGQSGRWSLYP